MSTKGDLYALFILSFLLPVFITGCAKPPVEEITRAEKALDEARKREARIYAEELFSRAEETLRKSNACVPAGKYEEAKATALEAEHLAREAMVRAELSRQRLKDETERLIEEMEKDLVRIRQAFDIMARKRSYDRTVIDTRNVIAKLETDLSGAKEMFKTGRFIDCLDRLKAMKGELDREKEELDQTTLKIRTTRRK